jgi:hypothetical protein
MRDGGESSGAGNEGGKNGGLHGCKVNTNFHDGSQIVTHIIVGVSPENPIRNGKPRYCFNRNVGLPIKQRYPKVPVNEIEKPQVSS